MPIEVNGVFISDDLIDYFMHRYQRENQTKGLAEIQLQVRNDLIKRALLISLAEKEDIKITEKDVFKKLYKYVGEKDIEEVKEELNRWPIGFEGFMRIVIDDIKIEKFLSKKFDINNYEVSDEEIVDFYLENKEYYDSKEKVRVSHILLKIPSDATENEKEKIFNRLIEIKYEEGTFEEKAKKYSDCTSADNGGDLGFIERGDMPENFEKVAFSLNVGEISNVVETSLGFHIIKCTDKIKGLDGYKEEIKKYLQNLKMHKDIEIFLLNELENATIVEY